MGTGAHGKKEKYLAQGVCKGQGGVGGGGGGGGGFR